MEMIGKAPGTQPDAAELHCRPVRMDDTPHARVVDAAPAGNAATEVATTR